MKNIRIYILILTALVFSCQPEEFPKIGERLSREEGIKGNWNVKSVIQIDEVAAAKDEAGAEMDITNLFDLEDYKINFDEESFTVEANGAPNFVDETGTWTFDNPEFPSKVLLYANGATEPTSEFTLERVPAEGFDLQVKFQRFTPDNKPFVSYLYTFSKVNN